MSANTFEELAKVDCSAHVEKKGKFTYLSWPFAFSELFKRFPSAQIEAREWNGFPAVQSPAGGWMVQVSVTIGDVRRSQWHPVLDNGNKPIAEPTVFQLNTSIQRAAVKAIALHGLGLYIYAGEDLPEGVEPEPTPRISEQQLSILIDQCADTETDVVAFAEWLKIDALESLTADRYEYALNALQAKRQKLGKKAA